MVNYLIMSIFIFGINVIPAFMPPTWMLLTFFHFKYDLEFVPTILIGALSATFGRITLAVLSQRFVRPLLSKKTQENFNSLGNFLNKRAKFTVMIILTYAFFPIPSNQVFIAAGLSKANILLIAFAFFIGRLISYSFIVGAAHKVVDRLDIFFTNQFSNTKVLIFEFMGFLLLYLISQIPWKKLLKNKTLLK